MEPIRFLATGIGSVGLRHDSGKTYTLSGPGGGVDAGFSPLNIAGHNRKIGSRAVNKFFIKIGIPIGKAGCFAMLFPDKACRQTRDL